MHFVPSMWNACISLLTNKPIIAETISQQNADGKLKHFMEIVASSQLHS
jgi:hypothetical protein